MTSVEGHGVKAMNAIVAIETADTPGLHRSEAARHQIQVRYRRFLAGWASDMLEVRRLGLDKCTWSASARTDDRAAA